MARQLTIIRQLEISQGLRSIIPVLLLCLTLSTEGAVSSTKCWRWSDECLRISRLIGYIGGETESRVVVRRFGRIRGKQMVYDTRTGLVWIIIEGMDKTLIEDNFKYPQAPRLICRQSRCHKFDQESKHRKCILLAF